MALARSASGPPGLSINTNSANSLFGSSTTPAAGGMFGNTGASKPGGLFGSTISAPQTGGLFGSTTAQPQSGGLFGSSTATSQPQTGGLFGSAPATTQPQSGGLFGSAPAASQPQTGGLFGSAQPTQGGGLFGGATSQPAQSGGLFGNSTTTSQPQQSGGLFSGLGQQNQSTGGGLFGASSSTQQPAQNGGGGLFGGLNNQNQNKPAGSLFGGLSNAQTQQQPQQQQSTMFSTQNNQNHNGGMFGNTLGGGGIQLGQTMNQQQSVPGVRIDMTNIKGTTRFNDLHDDLQKEISNMNEVILQQIGLKNDCDAIMPKHNEQLAQIPNDVEFCRRKLIGVENAFDSDVHSISAVQRFIKTDADHAKLCFKAIDVLKLPMQYHTPGIWSSSSSNENRSAANGSEEAQDIVGFFSSTADEMASTLDIYQKHILEIEQHLRGVEANSAQQINALVAKRNGGSSGQEDPLEQLTGALRDFESSLLGVAGKVGGAREGVQALQLGNYPTIQSGSRNGNRSGVY